MTTVARSLSLSTPTGASSRKSSVTLPKTLGAPKASAKAAGTLLLKSAGTKAGVPSTKATTTNRSSSRVSAPHAVNIRPPQNATLSSAVSKVQDPLTIQEAEKLLRLLKPKELAALADSNDKAEQVPACMALEYVGDKDLSWENAQVSLRKGSAFMKEILNMNGDRFITRRSLERMEHLGQLEQVMQHAKLPASVALAAYLGACIRAAKLRLGIGAPVVEAKHDAVPPLPAKVHIKDIGSLGAQAAQYGKTALFVCNGHASEVDAYFTYRKSCTCIDAMNILDQVSVTKTKTVKDMQKELGNRLQKAKMYGSPVHVSMGKSAVAFLDTYCSDEQFPASVFKNGLFVQEQGVADGCYSFVTTDFDLDAAREHLSKALPFFADMAIIEIDPKSFSE